MEWRTTNRKRHTPNSAKHAQLSLHRYHQSLKISHQKGAQKSNTWYRRCTRSLSHSERGANRCCARSIGDSTCAADDESGEVKDGAEEEEEVDGEDEAADDTRDDGGGTDVELEVAAAAVADGVTIAARCKSVLNTGACP